MSLVCDLHIPCRFHRKTLGSFDLSPLFLFPAMPVARLRISVHELTNCLCLHRDPGRPQTRRVYEQSSSA